MKTPVSYADVWEFWLRFTAKSPPTSILLSPVHILPFWEDFPIRAEDCGRACR